VAAAKACRTASRDAGYPNGDPSRRGYIGLRQNDNNLLIAGATASALLALLLDFALGQVEKSYEIAERKSASRRRFIALAIAGSIGTVVALGFLPGLKTDLKLSRTIAQPADQEKIVVGSKDFTESIILAEILSQKLEKEGVLVSRQFELAGNLAHESLLSGHIDVYPEYTGTAYTAILKHLPITDRDRVYAETKAEYGDKFDLEVSPYLGFGNDFAILVRGEVARANNLRTISDAVPIAGNWQAGFGQDFMSRADGYPGFARTYGFNFSRHPREMDLSLTYRALTSGELDIIAGNSTDGLIEVLDLYQLEDDKRYFPPYQAVFISRRSVSGILGQALSELANSISTEEMRRLNYEVDGNKRTSRDVAAEWLLNK
jgi:osmoprotectant transport system permease protein